MARMSTRANDWDPRRGTPARVLRLRVPFAVHVLADALRVARIGPGRRSWLAHLQYMLWIPFTGVFLAACVTAPQEPVRSAHLGMSRDELRFHLGEPLRIEPLAGGGEDWYYRFLSLETAPTGVAETHEEFGEKTSSVSVGLSFSKHAEERPVHVSSEGYVVEPLPKGKVAKD